MSKLYTYGSDGVMKEYNGRDAKLFLLSPDRRLYVYLNKYTFGNQQSVSFIVDYREVAGRLLVNLRFDLFVYAGMAYRPMCIYRAGNFQVVSGSFQEGSRKLGKFPQQRFQRVSGKI